MRRLLLTLALLLSAGTASAQDVEERREPYGLPVAPRVQTTTLRGGLEIGAGWRSGPAALGATVIDLGLGIDHIFGQRLALGGRFAWISAAGLGAGDDG